MARIISCTARGLTRSSISNGRTHACRLSDQFGERLIISRKPVFATAASIASRLINFLLIMSRSRCASCFFRLRTFFPTSEDNRSIACLHAGCFDFRENDFEVVAVKFFNVTQARRVEFGFDYVGLTRLFFRRRDIRFSMSFEVLVCAGEMCYNVRGDSDLQDNE